MTDTIETATETANDMTIEEAVAAWSVRQIRFREFLAITGYQRGFVQGVEKRKLWAYDGHEKGTGNWRSYSMKDILAFLLAQTLTTAGFDGEAAWAIVQRNVDEILSATLLRHEGEFSVMRNTIKIVIPSATIVRQVLDRIEGFYGRLAHAPERILTAHIAANLHFDTHPGIEFPT